MNRFLHLLMLFSALITTAYAQVNPDRVYVRPYTRSNGTRVEGYYRTAPNSTNRDNFSTRGNTNPYTGQPGYVIPDSRPLLQNYSAPSQPIGSDRPAIDEEALLKLIKKRREEEEAARQLSIEMANREKAEYDRQYALYGNLTGREYLALTNAIAFHDRYTTQAKQLIELTLSNLNYQIGSADGIIDAETIAGIKDFQRVNKLKPDGRVGNTTAQRMGLQITAPTY